MSSHLDVDYTDWKEQENGAYAVEIEEANYGKCVQLAAAAADGCWFYAENGSGCEYDAGETVGGDGEYLEIHLSADGHICVNVDENGDPVPEEVEMVKRYLAKLKAYYALAAEEKQA